MEEQIKRPRGRPRKPRPEVEPPKRPRGRPRKTEVIEAEFKEIPQKDLPKEAPAADIVKKKNHSSLGTRKRVEADIADGKRDARGVRLQVYKQYERGIDYVPTTGSELSEMYRLAKENMETARSNGGRFTKFENVEELQSAIIGYWAYLEKAANDGIPVMADVEGMCAFIEVSRKTLTQWERDDYKGFRATIEQAKNDIAAVKKQLGQQGKIPPLVMAMDMNNNHGYTQKQEVVLTPNNPLGDATPSDQLMNRYFDIIDD